MRGGSVSIYVVDVLRLNTSVFESIRHDANRPVTVLRRLSNVERVARHSVTDQFGVNLCAAAARSLEFFQNQYPGPFADHKSIAFCIKRATGVLGIIVASRQRPHRCESADAHWCDRCLRASSQHRIGISTLNNLEAVSNCMSAGRASGT